MKFKAVIFDLDGTLLDTLDDLADSMNAALENHSFGTHAVSDYKILVGKGMRNLVTMALPPDKRSDEIITACYNEMFEEYSKRWDRKTRPYEGIGALLDSLTDKRIQMAILSNKIDYITQPVVRKYLGKWKFEAVFGERNGIPRKPDPSSLFEIARIMGRMSEEIICLGDSGSDMTAAISAGMYPLGVRWGFRDAEELLVHGAEKVIGKPSELLAYF